MESPYRWACGVGVNLANSWWRRRFSERRTLARVGVADELARVAEPADVLAVRAAVAALPTRQRTALVLRYYAAMSVAEAAATMRCAEGTVKSLASQGLSSLRVALTEPSETEVTNA